MIERRRDQPLGLRRRVLRRQGRAGAHNRLGHPVEQVEFAVAQRVVRERVALLRRQVRRADQMKHREMLGVGTRNTAHRGEFAHPEGGAQRGDAAHPGITIRGVGGIELVTAGDPIQRWVLDDRVVDRKRVIPRDSEDVIDANLLEPPQDILNDGFSHEVTSIRGSRSQRDRDRGVVFRRFAHLGGAIS